jgi:hypothetical protein
MNNSMDYVSRYYITYATRQNAAGSIPDEATGFFNWHIFPAALGSGVDSASNISQYQESSWE